MAKSNRLILTASAGILILSLLTGCSGLPDSESSPTAPSSPVSGSETLPQTHTDPVETIPAAQTVEFPLTLEDTELQIDSLFPYDGINPDCGYEESRSIAAIKLVNPTNRHLSAADITLTMSDGSELHFRAAHIAPGRSASVFCIDNSSLTQSKQCVDVRCQAEFAEEPASDAVTAVANGMEITVTNDSGKDIQSIVLYCHNILGDEYFGGIAYPYEINGLPAGESTTLFAADCLLGIADVSYISVIY